MAYEYLKDITLTQCVQKWFTAEPKRTIVDTMSANGLVKTSYEQMFADIMAWAEFFSKHGVKKGDRVVMVSPKCPSHFRFFHTCFYTGAIAVPICETLGDKEMSFIIADSAPTLIFADKSLVKKVTANAEGLPVVSLDDMPQNVPLDTPVLPPAETTRDDVVLLSYTSGSTGMPKGVMLTSRNLLANTYSLFNIFSFDHDDSVISLLPYWHTLGLIVEIVCVPAVCASVHVPRDIRDFKVNIAKYRPTIMIAVPRILETIKQGIDKIIRSASPRARALVEKAIYNASRIFTAGPRLDGGILRMLTHHLFYDPLVFRKFRKAFGGRLRFFIVGGAPMDLEIQIFFKYMGIVPLIGYGLTETSPVISVNTPEQHRLGTCGKPLMWVTPEFGGDFTFKDEEGHIGKELRGQLLVKGDCVMKGYWNHTDDSAKTMEDGWLNTGDMGFCDREGFINIQGRKGSMIVLVGGEKLHPEHIEDAVKNSPYIAEAMVIGEKCKNVYLCVNVNQELTKGMSDDEIHAKLKEEMQATTKHLAAYQKPKEVLVLPPFSMEDGTMTATLKIRRFKIKEIYKTQIEDFLQANGEELATKHELGIASSKVLQSLEQGEAVVGNGNVVK